MIIDKGRGGVIRNVLRANRIAGLDPSPPLLFSSSSPIVVILIFGPLWVTLEPSGSSNFGLLYYLMYRPLFLTIGKFFLSLWY
jgi:hypothetical protein